MLAIGITIAVKVRGGPFPWVQPSRCPAEAPVVVALSDAGAIKAGSRVVTIGRCLKEENA
jgi:hypothetical protein